MSRVRIPSPAPLPRRRPERRATAGADMQEEAAMDAGAAAQPRVVMSGLAFPESPRWHEGRLWFSDWGADQVIALDVDGRSEVVARVASFTVCIDHAPDGRLLIVSSDERRLLRMEPDGSLTTLADLGDYLTIPGTTSR